MYAELRNAIKDIQYKRKYRIFFVRAFSFVRINVFDHPTVVRNSRNEKFSHNLHAHACPRVYVRVQGRGRLQNSIFSLICQAVTAKTNSRSLFRAAAAALADQADSFVSLFTTNLRRNLGEILRKKKALVKNKKKKRRTRVDHCAIVRYRIKDCCMIS